MPQWSSHAWRVLASIVLFAMLACGGDDKSPTGPGVSREPALVEIAERSLVLTALGDTARLTATVKDAKGTAISGAAIDWSSTDTTVVRVNASGRVTAIANGSARVVARAAGVADTVPVEVEQVPASIEVSPDSVGLGVGDTVRLTVAVADGNGAEIRDAVLDWASADTSVVRVDGTGLVTAVAEGRSEVHVRAGEVDVSAKVTVTAPATGQPGDKDPEDPEDPEDPADPEDPEDPEDPGDPEPAGLEVTPGSIELDALGDSVRVSAVVRDADGAEIEGAEVNWTSTDPAVVTVNSAGWVVAVGNGAARVVATIGELADSVSVDVEQRPASVQASPEQIRLGVGDTLRVEAVVLDANDHPIAGAEVTWRSTVPSDVSVDSTGLVEALTWGASARVIASSGEFSDTVSVGGKDQIVVTTATGFALINDDGTNFHEIGGHRGRNPTWAPASNKLAYLTVVGQPGYRLFMLDELDGTATPRLVAPAEAAQTVHWSSKGKIIFDFTTYDIHRKIVVVNPDGSGLQDVAADAYENSDPAWSPDGRHFVYVSQRDSAHLVVANDDGSGKTSLVKSSGRLFSPVWTLNGQEIVYTRYASSTYTLYRVNVTTGVTTELGPGRYAERASLGNRIAAVDKNAESGAWELYIYDLNANTMTTHTLSVPVSDRPLWSPDNQKLLLSTGDSLLVFHLDRGEEDIVAAAGMDLHSARSFAWRPRKPLVIVPQL